MPTALETKLLKQLSRSNTMRLDEFMRTALLDPKHGYYTNRKVFGKDGDFITAPDVSQIFGEVIAAYFTANIMAARSSKPATLVEFGPGRGTLMHDMLRSFSSMPAELEISEVVLVEASPRLVDIQKETLKDSHLPIRWVESADELPESPCFIIANEFFDALPIRQFTEKDSGWNERVITAKEDSLAWAEENCSLPDGCEPPKAPHLHIVNQPENVEEKEKILEYSEAVAATTQQLSVHISNHGGMLVAIDYGHTAHGFADTLQAVKKHKFIDVLSHVGEADITAHVNFALMKEVAEASSLNTHLLTTQGKFLRSLGAELRAMTLVQSADKNGQIDIASGLERLIAPTQMGELFKVLVVAHPELSVLELGV